MATFKQREEVSREPDTMANVYAFVKVDPDDFISFIDGQDQDRLWSVEKSPVEWFLENRFPEYYWSVSGSSIYKSLIKDPPGVYFLQHDFKAKDGTIIPAGVKWYDKCEYLNDVSRSELQKWVQKFETTILNLAPKTTIPTTEVRKILKGILGK